MGSLSALAGEVVCNEKAGGSPCIPSRRRWEHVYTMRFDGGLLARGFWLYVWRITHGERVAFYVGRTGDTSSRFASSPFRRIGQHLDLRPSAKGNSLSKQLESAGLPAKDCAFDMVAVGPVFDEQQTLEKHLEFMRKTAALERALADYLRGLGHQVLGEHPRLGVLDEGLRDSICRAVSEKLWGRPTAA